MSIRMKKLARTIKTQGPQVRQFNFDRASINEDSRTIEISFSSETRDVVRWFGIEVLGHDPGEARMERINSAGPMLMDHNTRDQVGVIEKAWIDPATRKGRAVVRFGRSARAEEIWTDVKDGIRKNVSFMYDVYRFILEEEGKNGQPDVLRAVDWEPLEISVVSIPADISVGVGRSHDHQPRDVEIYVKITETDPEPEPPEGEDTMNCETCGKPVSQCSCGRHHTPSTPAPVPGVVLNADTGRTLERARIREIQAIASAFPHVSGVDEMARQFVDNGQDVSAFNAAILAKMRSSVIPAQVAAPVDLNLTQRDQAQYSVLRAISVAAGLAEPTGIEMDIHQEICRKLGRSSKGMFVPMSLRSMQGQRAPLIGGGTGGQGAGYTVATEVRDMIELLRAKMMVRRLGAQVLSGLTSNVAFPRQTGTTTLYWTGENPGSDVTETEATIDQVTLTPKTAQATTAYSRQLLVQSSVDVENFVRNDLTAINALGLDYAAINGSGSSNQPRGVLNSGIGSVAGGTNGATPTFTNMVALEASVATANADVGSLGYLSTTKARGYLKTTPRFTNVDTPIWTDTAENDWGMVNGYKAAATTQVPSNLVKGASGAVCSAVIFGNWADLLIGEFGVIELIADPYAKKRQGLIEVTSFMMCDIAVRHPASFAAMLDALTTGF